MLKNIRFHIEKDEDKQAEIEALHVQELENRLRANVNAFQRVIPSVVPYITGTHSQNISIVCNKHGEFNIVDFGIGRVFYGENPAAEIEQQVTAFTERATYVAFGEQDTQEYDESTDSAESLTQLLSYKKRQSSGPLPEQCKLMIVLGLGLGHHIRELLESVDIEHLIIYEPEVQYVKCSAMVVDWKHILDLAKKNKTALYFQIGKDSRDVLKDIEEFRTHFDVNGTFLYQHYNHPIFDSVYQQLVFKPWNTLKREGITFSHFKPAELYCPLWSLPATPELWTDVDTTSRKFVENLEAFKRYIPDIYDSFKSYVPRRWLPVVTENGEINIVEKDRLVPWYGPSPLEESLCSFSGFSENPNKDGLVLGYKGNKLRDYLHYRFVHFTEDYIEKLVEEQEGLQETVRSIILFGIGSGYQLEALMENHKVEKLFLCEPNRDFFYASLFAIDWKSVLEKVDKSNGRIYLNVGDDGTNLFRDLLNQFYSIGPYILSNTYFYQCYYDDTLNEAIAQLREQLQVVISMGEYYDHARYGIAHTKEVLLRGHHFLRKKPKQYLTYDDKNVPVFVVGNGPSIDYAIETIKEYQDRAIIVSCGTALQVLHRNGIVPDFQAEIEQNRATYDWAARIQDDDYLKKINLLSCNGIHPDTCDLYKDTYIAFKLGESSTVSTLKVLGEDNYETLAYAFPTVANFTLNLFAMLGSQQIYLFGIDLGFAEAGKHHSSQSGYYSAKGVPLYDYDTKNNTSLVVPGNFRKTVFTKHEFKVSRVILEQTLAKTPAVECYNCSDGARIAGATPLPIEDILITTSEAQKSAFLDSKLQAFGEVENKDFSQAYASTYSSELLGKEVDKFRSILAKDVSTIDEAYGLVEEQRIAIFKSYEAGRSLLFYLFYGSFNYANAVLSKIAGSSNEPDIVLPRFNEVKESWADSFDLMSRDWQLQSENFDRCSSLAIYRINSRTLELLRTQKIAIYFENDETLPEFTAMITRGELTYSVLDDVSAQNADTHTALTESDSLLLFVDSLTEAYVEKVVHLSSVYPNLRVVLSCYGIAPNLSIAPLLDNESFTLQLLWPTQTDYVENEPDHSFMYSLPTSDHIFFIWALAADSGIKLHIPRIKMVEEHAKLSALHQAQWDTLQGMFNDTSLSWYASAHMLHGRKEGSETSIVDRQFVRSNKLLIEPELRDLVYGVMSDAELQKKKAKSAQSR